MRLEKLLEFIRTKEICGDTAREITGLCTDSRKVKEGNLFFCYKGKKHDSHENAAEAAERGAAAVVCERKLDIAIPQIIVADGRAAVAPAARAFYDFADKKLKIIGVTGTNGKTTVTYMLEAIFRAAGKETGVIGTLGIRYGDKAVAPELTTPDPVFLHSVLADMAESGVEYVFTEVSAHALHFGKVDGITFDAGIFTNCTQDHLDFFGNMESYSRCKMSMFRDGRCRYAIINSDDALGEKLLLSAKNSFSYGLDNPADVFAVDIRERIDGTDMVLNLFDELYDVKLNLAGRHNVYNAMAAAACAKLFGVSIGVIAEGLKNLRSVTGRLEKVASFNGADIFVDFAHTPDGLEKSLSCLKKLCKGKLYCVFGCGGNRDKTKRPIMGAVAAAGADFCIITSDNPRFEDPYDIIREVASGISDGKSYVAVTERETATEYAIRLLSAGDILLVAGKGGEDYQEIMGIKHAYNDNKVIQKIIGSQ